MGLLLRTGSRPDTPHPRPTTISLSDSCKATNLTRNPLVSPLASEASAQVDELSDVPIGFATLGRSLFITPPHLCATLSRACAFRTCRLPREATFLFFYPPTHNQSRVYRPRCDLASEIAVSLKRVRPAPRPLCLAPPHVHYLGEPEAPASPLLSPVPLLSDGCQR